MNTMLLMFCLKIENLVNCEEGQDLIEYALVLALIVCVSIASMRTVAASISTELSVIESTFSSTI